MNKYFIIFIIYFSFISSSISENREIELNRLFNELKINNVSSSYIIEQKIWKLWSQHPTNQNLTIKLEKGSEYVRNKKLLKAVEIFTEVIELDPEWAEAWNKRATVLYMIGDYQGSQNDIDKVLNLEK